MKGQKVRLVSAQVSEETLRQDLERYRQEAIKMGATEAKIIPAEMVETDERVRLKCWIGRCHNYGQCAYCPPYTPEPEFMRKAFSRFHWAIIFRSDIIPVADYADIEQFVGAKHDRQTLEIAAAIESQAFRDGYYLAMGLGCGNCRNGLCDDMYCQALDSKRCRFPLRARPSMEAVGIDVFGLAARIGWKMYPIYRTVDPEAVPCANSLGLTFIY